MSKYCIRTDYKINTKKRPENDAVGLQYTTPEKKALSGRYQRSVYEAALKIARDNHCEAILEVGCGPATNLNAFFSEGFKIYGVDHDSAISQCQRMHRNGTYLSDDIESSIYGLKHYIDFADLIICSSVFEHLKDPASALEFIKTFAHPGTFIVISTPERNALCGKNAVTPSNEFHIREWSFDEFHRFIIKAGFKIEEQKMMLPFSFGFDPMTAAYCAKRILRGLPLATTQMVVCKVK
ncbi:MAG: class I SAM-dependent methyltransferase [Candidatus Omnitrophota bacterium]